MLLENSSRRIHNLTVNCRSIERVLSIGKDCLYINLIPYLILAISSLWYLSTSAERSIQIGLYMAYTRIQVVSAAEVTFRVFAIVVEHLRQFGGHSNLSM